MTGNLFIRAHLHELMLVIILLAAEILYFYNLGQMGFANQYYAAAIRSMLENSTNIIWGSFDPAGFVTVDKPPGALWIQYVSTLIFGFNGFALIAPQALAGVGGVLLIYLLVSRPYGKPAGLLAALALTVTPIAVAMGRTNNLDGLLIFVVLLAVLMAVQAWKKGSLWYLLGSTLLIGFGFNIKMIEAFAVVPACFTLYLLTTKIPLKKRVVHLMMALCLLIIISFSWAALVEITPAEDRPYIGSSENNSVFDLIFGYNGLSRIIGSSHQAGPGGLNHSISSPSMQSKEDMPGTERGVVQDQGMPPGIHALRNSTSVPNHMGSSFSPPMGGGRNEGGDPGLFRLGNEEMAGQISWLLPFALLGLLAFIKRPSRRFLSDIGEREILVIAMALWLIPEILYFSFTTGHFHRYYLAMVAPPLAGLVGIGGFTMYERYRSDDFRGWFLVLAIPVTGCIQAIILLYTPDFSGPLPWIVLIGTLLTGLVLAVARIKKIHSEKIIQGVFLLAMVFLLISPLVWSCTPVIFPGNGQIPVAGPELISGKGTGGNHGPGMMNSNEDYSSLVSYLQAHRTGETYLVGMQSAMSGASFIIVQTGEPVMTLGGFSGSDSILTITALQNQVLNGTVRYFYFSSGMGGGQAPGSFGGADHDFGAFQWVKDSCVVIPDSEWSGNETQKSGFGSKNILYDCGSMKGA